MSFTAILTAKIGDHRLHRKIALEGHRYTATEALQDGILDYVVKGQTADILAKAEEVADKVSGNAANGVWGLIKVCFHKSIMFQFIGADCVHQLNLYREPLLAIQQDVRLINPMIDDAAARSRL